MITLLNEMALARQQQIEDIVDNSYDLVKLAQDYDCLYCYEMDNRQYLYIQILACVPATRLSLEFKKFITENDRIKSFIVRYAKNVSSLNFSNLDFIFAYRDKLEEFIHKQSDNLSAIVERLNEVEEEIDDFNYDSQESDLNGVNILNAKECEVSSSGVIKCKEHGDLIYPKKAKSCRFDIASRISGILYRKDLYLVRMSNILRFKGVRSYFQRTASLNEKSIDIIRKLYEESESRNKNNETLKCSGLIQSRLGYKVSFSLPIGFKPLSFSDSVTCITLTVTLTGNESNDLGLEFEVLSNNM